MAYKGGSMTALRDPCFIRALNIARQSIARQEGWVYMHIWGCFSLISNAYTNFSFRFTLISWIARTQMGNLVLHSSPKRLQPRLHYYSILLEWMERVKLMINSLSGDKALGLLSQVVDIHSQAGQI